MPVQGEVSVKHRRDASTRCAAWTIRLAELARLGSRLGVIAAIVGRLNRLADESRFTTCVIHGAMALERVSVHAALEGNHEAE